MKELEPYLSNGQLLSKSSIFEIKFKDEEGVDIGGLFRESLSMMDSEIQEIVNNTDICFHDSNSVSFGESPRKVCTFPLFRPTPNMFGNVGAGRKWFMFELIILKKCGLWIIQNMNK